ncbi:hypothetical protein GCK72_014615 [Caenorhabditis remanei]|uniref:Uncharacterized protein n=1 Tax=Caenorhabditis remanei TaxID=31234 RepID=A0A6A5GSK3_CAERE|nr:hypothetical protein GCK72_014615 [Caenorhabditis remanei]KAF1758157.1 hypothetical protein GCK72_014615 [Caenorhabditis remanei]
MIGKSEKTNQWILGYILFNLVAFSYIYLCFNDGWISTFISVVVPLFVWEILIFGVLAPDEVFMDLMGEYAIPISNARSYQSPVQSVRDVIVSSGDH